MRKLNLSDLEVVSFATADAQNALRGTVEGHDNTYVNCRTYVDGCTNGITCVGGVETCINSCVITECQGPGGTGTEVYTCAGGVYTCHVEGCQIGQPAGDYPTDFTCDGVC